MVADLIMKGSAMLYMLLLSIALLFGLMLLRRKRYHVSVWKTLIITALVGGLGILSTQLLYFIENEEWGGMSFFGAVFFLPLIFVFISRLLRIPFNNLTDFIAPPGLLMFSVMKVNCYVSGCCGGRVLSIGANSIAVTFPSQLVEAGVTVLLISVLLFLEYKGKTKNRLYPISMLSYGVLRFVLNWFRLPGATFVLGMQKGTFWSVIAIVIGILWLMILRNKELDEQLARLQQERVSIVSPASAEEE